MAFCKRARSARLSAMALLVSVMASLVLALFPKPAQAMTAAEYFLKSDAFISDARWKNGITWNGSQMPKLSTWTSYGCYAYACDFSMYMYGKRRYEDGTRFTNVNDIRTGDVVRISGHTFAVLERIGNDLRTAEGNYGGSSRYVRVANPGYTISNGTIYRVESAYSTTAVRFEAGWHFDTGGASTRSVSHKVNWVRLSGTYRFDTMKAIVDKGWSGAKGGTVVVATGYNYKDALSASGLAGLYGAPVVLTSGSSLSSQAREVLVSLKPSKVFVAGGEAAVSNGVLDAIASATGVQPERKAGVTAAATSAELAQAGKGLWGDTAIITTTKGFQDALSVAPVAYAKGWPILLATNGNDLESTVMNALGDCGIKKVLIVGGPQAVTAEVEQKLRGAGITVLPRLYGTYAVDTSKTIATWALGNGLGANNMAYATSVNFPDALAGAALCGKNKAVLLLADGAHASNVSFAIANLSAIKTGYVLGGTAAVSEGLVAKLP